MHQSWMVSGCCRRCSLICRHALAGCTCAPEKKLGWDPISFNVSQEQKIPLKPNICEGQSDFSGSLQVAVSEREHRCAVRTTGRESTDSMRAQYRIEKSFQKINSALLFFSLYVNFISKKARRTVAGILLSWNTISWGPAFSKDCIMLLPLWNLRVPLYIWMHDVILHFIMLEQYLSVVRALNL